MASVKVKFKANRASSEGNVIYRITHKGISRVLYTSYRIRADEWNQETQTVVSSSYSSNDFRLSTLNDNIKTDLALFSELIFKYKVRNREYQLDSLIRDFTRYAEERSLVNYTSKLIARLRTNGRVRTSETYLATLKSITKFLATGRVGTNAYGELPDTEFPNDILLDRITTDVLEAYEAWHEENGHSPNTTSFYMRILRAIYNRAVDEGKIEPKNPFRRVYTGIGKTIKRALPIHTIRNIRKLNLEKWPNLDLARDIFILSFYLRGMSFIDMAFLKKTDLRNGFIKYRRRKTGQMLSIGWTAEMQDIVDKYPENPTEFLLPILTTKRPNQYYAYRNANYTINRNLKKIGQMVELSLPLTLYVARHSWASAAKTNGIPIGVISEGMGHTSEMTTQIYLTSLETSVVDQANSIIIGSIK